MPLQRIILTREAAKLLGWLEKEGPYEMKEGIFEASAAAQELKEKCLADYENGTLRLIKHCKAWDEDVRDIKKKVQPAWGVEKSIFVNHHKTKCFHPCNFKKKS